MPPGGMTLSFPAVAMAGYNGLAGSTMNAYGLGYHGSTISGAITYVGYNAFIMEDQKPLWDALPDDGVKVGEIIAYRGWSVEDDRLLSVGVQAEWLPNEPMKGDPHGYVVGPGVYAFKERKTAISQLGQNFYAIGTVKLWGQIVEHETGYRAEYGKIVSIDSFPYRVGRAAQRRICERYGLPKPKWRFRCWSGLKIMSAVTQLFAVFAAINAGVAVESIGYDDGNVAIMIIGMMLFGIIALPLWALYLIIKD